MKKEHTPTWYRKKLVERAKKLARERDNNKCVWCGNDGERKQLHGSHVFPEGRYPNMSDVLDNIKMLCANCHIRKWHEHPIQGVEWFKSKYPKRYAKLKKLSLQNSKRDWKKEYEEIQTSRKI